MVLAESKSQPSNDPAAAFTGEPNRPDTVKTSTPTKTEPVAVVTTAHLNGVSERVATLDTGDLKEFDSVPAPIQQLIIRGLALTRENLVYKYGSADPANGGMDCSGTVYYLLGLAGVKDVPRDASELYTWVWKAGLFNAVVSSNPKTFEFQNLKPGDLLFWTGTYSIDRDPPVTHVMIYLGTSRKTGRRIMLGASEGRRYNDVSRSGVSVFDFELSRPTKDTDGPDLRSAHDLGSRFIGYGSIPGFPDNSPPVKKENL